MTRTGGVLNPPQCSPQSSLFFLNPREKNKERRRFLDQNPLFYTQFPALPHRKEIRPPSRRLFTMVSCLHDSYTGGENRQILEQENPSQTYHIHKVLSITLRHFLLVVLRRKNNSYTLDDIVNNLGFTVLWKSIKSNR